jgi:FlaA1/EpsC-like NDP-sugar epimerase
MGGKPMCWFRKHWWLGASARYLAIVAASYWLAWLLRFDLNIPRTEMPSVYKGFLIVVVVKMLLSVVMGLRPERVWGYQGLSEVLQLFFVTVTASATASLAVFMLAGPVFPRSVYLLDPFTCFLISGGARFAARLYRDYQITSVKQEGRKGVLIYGAGTAGIALAREIRNNPKLGYQVIGFLDDDPQKRYMKLMGLSVFGCGNDAKQIVAQCARRGQ